MRRIFVRSSLMATLVVSVIIGLMPAGAAPSAYHMNGQGSITLGGGGLPACAHVVNQGDCLNVDIPFSWGDLTVQGAGLLQGLQVAGQYDCKSEGTGFQSRIMGNTTNFELTFNFACSRTVGVGPSNINGWFSNYNGGSANPNFRNTTTHRFGPLAQPGTFSFVGYFRADNTTPSLINASNGAEMICGGGFAPTAFSGLRITTAAFAGECNAVRET